MSQTRSISKVHTLLIYVYCFPIHLFLLWHCPLAHILFFLDDSEEILFFFLLTSLMSLGNLPYMCHRQLPYRISIFPTRQNYVFLKPKANVTVWTASGLLFVSNIKRSPFHSRNSGLFPFIQHSTQDSKDSVKLFMEIICDCTWTFRQFCPGSIHHLQASCQPDALTSDALRLHFLLSYWYPITIAVIKSFISEPNNYLLGYVEARKLVCTSRSNESARKSALLLLHWLLEIERDG